MLVELLEARFQKIRRQQMGQRRKSYAHVLFCFERYPLELWGHINFGSESCHVFPSSESKTRRPFPPPALPGFLGTMAAPDVSPSVSVAPVSLAFGYHRATVPMETTRPPRLRRVSVCVHAIPSDPGGTLPGSHGICSLTPVRLGPSTFRTASVPA